MALPEHPLDDEPRHPTPSDRAHAEQLLDRARDIWLRELPSIHECELDIATLVATRACRPWTNDEHAAYLRLRRLQQRLHRRTRRAQRVFDKARARLRDMDAYDAARKSRNDAP
jgi:hypothetical protein